MSISLYNIQSALLELAALREAYEDEGDAQAVAVIDQQIGEYLDREPAKVDSCCAIARKVEAEADACEEESKRLAVRAKSMRGRMAAWKESWLRAMKLRDIKELKTATNTMRRQANGGKQALEVDLTVPEQYQDAVVQMPLHLWRRIQRNLSEAEYALVTTRSVDVDRDAIREALSRRVECPECKGQAPVSGNFCQRCEDSGTIPATVPGARLLPRGESLRIL